MGANCVKLRTHGSAQHAAAARVHAHAHAPSVAEELAPRLPRRMHARYAAHAFPPPKHHLSFAALPPKALALLFSLLPELHDRLALALVERATLAAMLSAALQVHSVPLLLRRPSGLARKSFVRDLRSPRDVLAFFGACTLLSSVLELRPLPHGPWRASEFPRTLLLHPACVRTAAVELAAQRRFAERLRHFLRHAGADATSPRFRFVCAEDEATAAAGGSHAPARAGSRKRAAHVDVPHVYSGSSASPRSAWVRETYVNDMAPRLRLVLSTLLALLRAAGSAAPLCICQQYCEAWCGEMCAAICIALQAVQMENKRCFSLRRRGGSSVVRCANLANAPDDDVDCSHLFADAGEALQLLYVREPPGWRPSSRGGGRFSQCARRRVALSASAGDALGAHVSETYGVALADGVACACAHCDALQACACRTLTALALSGGPAALHRIACPRFPDELFLYEEEELAVSQGAVLLLLRACFEHPLKPQLRREGARSLALLLAALVCLHDAQQAEST
jgi:hypothetical protein